MSDPSTHQRTARISLRRLLAFVTVAAVGCVALKYANEWWVAGVAAFTLVAFMAAVVVALVDRGPRQAFAIGFAACAAIYGGMVASSRWFYAGGAGAVVPNVNREMDPDGGTLPTSQALGALYRAVVVEGYIDHATGQRSTSRPGPPGQPLSPSIGIRQEPAPTMFMPVGHCLWLLMLAYAGGLFAKFVNARRMRDEQRSDAPSA
jgi:hypothetical protein